ncbi:ACP S-malonyltransferase [soil metagenome]
MGIAVVFPGQGSQSPSAGRPWLDHGAWTVVAEAEAAAGEPFGRLLLDADAEELAPTRASQLSVLLTSLVAWRAVEPTLDTAELVGVAGHSLGQITALIAAGAVSVADGIALAVARADACAHAQQESPGALLALLGADEATATAACEAAPGAAWVANLNGAGQVVVGGHAESLDAVAERAAELGIRRSRRLAVDGAFHTPLMAPAADRLSPVLDTIAFAAPWVPIVTNHDGTAVTADHGWPERLTTHLVSPVRWADTVECLVELGADTIIEVGPGTTLSGLVRRIAPSVEVRSVSSPDHLPAQARR